MEERKKEQECKISEWGIECQQTHKEERKNEQECKISDWGSSVNKHTKTYSSSCPIRATSWTPWLVFSRVVTHIRTYTHLLDGIYLRKRQLGMLSRGHAVPLNIRRCRLWLIVDTTIWGDVGPSFAMTAVNGRQEKVQAWLSYRQQTKLY
jgi:hypothetical protein